MIKNQNEDKQRGFIFFDKDKVLFSSHNFDPKTNQNNTSKSNLKQNKVFTKSKQQADILSNKPFSKTKPYNIKSDISKKTKKFNQKDFSKKYKPKLSTQQESNQNNKKIDSKLIESIVNKSLEAFESRKSKSNLLLVSGIYILIIILTVNTFLVLPNTVSNRFLGIASETNSENDIVTATPSQNLASNIENGYQEKKLLDFENNDALLTIGSQIKIKDGKITNKNHSNCRTSSEPPEKNGCNFVLNPHSLGIDRDASILRSLELSGNIPGDSRIKLSVKNFEDGSLKEVADIKRTNLKQEVILPEYLRSVEALRFNLWSKEGQIEIDDLAFKFFNVNKLESHTLTIDNTKNILTKGDTLKFYYDADKNQEFDEQIDQLWECRPYFPGVMSVEVIQDEVSEKIKPDYKLFRDDECFQGVKPEDWFTQEQDSVLPVGHWLAVNLEKDVVIPFEVKIQDENLKI